MSNLFFNQIKVESGANAQLAHNMAIKRLCAHNKRHPREHQEFNTPELINSFMPGSSSMFSELTQSQLSCKSAYVDDRLMPGAVLKILSTDSPPYGLLEIYLMHLFKIDPKVIVSMYSYTCHSNEEWICNLIVQNGVICQI